MDNKPAALLWVDMLEDQANALGRFPEKGRPYKDDYRVKLVDRGYRIFYRVDHERETVVIVHFSLRKPQYSNGLPKLAHKISKP